jgi:hypothetical protein
VAEPRADQDSVGKALKSGASVPVNRRIDDVLTGWGNSDDGFWCPRSPALAAVHIAAHAGGKVHAWRWLRAALKALDGER